MINATNSMIVSAICDANDAMRKKAQEKFPSAQIYSSYKEMFKKGKLDCVTIATPHNLHAPIAIEALNAGINVIVEKPMATSYKDCCSMISAANKNKKFLTVFHNRRLDGWFLAAQSVIKGGYLGEPVEYTAAVNYRPGPQTWRGYKKESGGLMFDWGAHLVDYLLHFVNSEVKAVSGFNFRSKNNHTKYCEDHCSVRIYFANGSVGNAVNSGVDQFQQIRYRLVGTKGTLIDEWNWEEKDKLKVYTRLDGGEQAVMEVAYRKTNNQKYYDNIADNLTKGTPLMVSAVSAAKVINILCTAEESHKKGGTPLQLH